MKYIRTQRGRIIDTNSISIGNNENDFRSIEHYLEVSEQIIIRQADTIEELIQIGDIVFYWAPSDDKEHCVVINYETELHSIKYNAITKLLIPVGEDYKCVAKGYPSFNLIKNKRYLVNKGELELL